MSGKSFVQAIFALVLILVLATSTAVAQYIPTQKTEPNSLHGPYTPQHSLQSLLEVGFDPSVINLETSNLGKTGTTFRYMKTIGFTDIPYTQDSVYLNHPTGLYIQPGSNELLVTETHNGFRVLKYRTDKTHLLSLGHAGVWRSDSGFFQSASDAVISPDGQIWVADWSRIMEFSANGEFIQEFPAEESWRGGNEHGRFDGATSLIFDQSGHLFVADQNNHRVEVFTWIPGGVPVYKATIGTGAPGNGLNELNRPNGVRVGPNGELFILDYGNNRVKKCPYNNSTSTWSCVEFLSGLNEPQGLYIDGNGVVYVSDTANGLVHKCVATNCISFAVKDGSFGVAADSQGNIYFANAWHCTIDKYNTNGVFVETLLGVRDTCYITDEHHFFAPRVEIDSQGNMLVLEEWGHRLMKFDPNGKHLWTFGEPGRDYWDNQHLIWPHGIDTDKAGNIYVANQWRVMVISPTGLYIRSYGPEEYEDPARIISWATDVAVNDTNGNVYVVDNNNHRVVIYNKDGAVSGIIGQTGVCQSSNLGLCGPAGIEVDESGNIYVGDWGNSRVQKFNSLHQWVMTLGVTGEGGDLHHLISGPDDIEVDANGNIYVADMNNNRVQVFDATGAYLATVGGTWGTGTAEFRQLSDVSVAPDGKIYVSDINTMRVQVFAPGYLGWQQKNINGFGERFQNHISGLEVLNGQLFASTCNYGVGGQVWRSAEGSNWEMVADAGVINGPDDGCITNLIAFNNQLYASSGWGNNPASLWRYDGAKWLRVFETEATGFYGMETFGGKLYVCSQQSAIDGPGLSIFKSASGNLNDWTEMAAGGNGNWNNYVCSLGKFQDRLYAFTENEVDGLEVWRLNTNGTSWDVLATDGLGDSSNFSSGGMAVLNNTMYLGSLSYDNGGVIKKSTNGVDWTTVMTGGFGNPANEKVESLMNVDGKLYAVLNNLDGLEVWRSSDGINWEVVSTMGLGDPENVATLGNNAATIFKGSLFLGLRNDAKGGQIVQLQYQKTYLPITRR